MNILGKQQGRTRQKLGPHSERFYHDQKAGSLSCGNRILHEGQGCEVSGSGLCNLGAGERQCLQIWDPLCFHLHDPAPSRSSFLQRIEVGVGCGTGQPTGLDQAQDMVLLKPWDGVTQALGPRQMGTAVFGVVAFPEDSSFALTDRPMAGPRGDSY